MVQEVDEHLAREVELWYENKPALYRQSLSWVLNFLRKMKGGVYNREMAIRGIAQNFIPNVISDYRREFSLPQVNLATKIYLAQRWVESFEAEARLGNYTIQGIQRTLSRPL